MIRNIRQFLRENIKAELQAASRLASLHCGYQRQLRMRRRLTMQQSELHSPLCSGFYSSAQFGSIVDVRVHSLATIHTHSSDTTKCLANSRAPVLREMLTLHTLRELYVCQRYGPPSRWCRALLFQRHLTRTQPGSLSETPQTRV